MPANDTIRRMIYLVQILQDDDPRSSMELAEECGVSRRTIFRDLDRLEDLGVRIDLTDDGYRLLSQADLENFFRQRRRRRRRQSA